MPFSGGGLCAIKCGNSFWIVRGSMNLRARQSFQLQAHRNFFYWFFIRYCCFCFFAENLHFHLAKNAEADGQQLKRNNNKDDALHAWVTEPTNGWDDVGLGLPPRSTITIRRHNRIQRRAKAGARAGDTWVNWGKQAKPSQNGKSYEWSLLLGELKRNFIAKKEAKEAERTQEQHSNNYIKKRRSRKINENQVRMCIHNERVFMCLIVSHVPRAAYA